MEATMQIVRGSQLQPSLVTATFKDIVWSFELPAGATMMDLADYLAFLGEVRGEKPIEVDVALEG
jgi:hypothetical protein